MGRITPEHYDGVIWCVTVSTGAFVAVRNGMAFPTGNSGFPKSLDVSKAIDKAAGAEREVIGPPPYRRGKAGQSYSETRKVSYDCQPLPVTAPASPAAKQWSGWGTALKPSWEPICLARKPLIGTVAANVLAHGTGALNIDATRIPTADKLGGGGEKAETSAKFTNDGWKRPWMEDPEALEKQAAKVRANVAKSESLGRFPANLLHDGSDEVLACFPDAPGQQGDVKGTEPSRTGDENTVAYGKFNGRVPAKARRDGEASANSRYTDAGATNFAALPGMRRSDGASAARFFYQAKADSADRLGSKHPTVKPIDLMQWLVRLVCPKGGVVLDPFAGTGTTGEAAWREGMHAVLIEREEEYQADIARRMDLATKPTKRAAVAKTKNNLDDPNSLPLFGKAAE